MGAGPFLFRLNRWQNVRTLRWRRRRILRALLMFQRAMRWLMGLADRVICKSMMADSWEGIPQTKSGSQVTLLEEEKIMAWFGGAAMYAKPDA